MLILLISICLLTSSNISFAEEAEIKKFTTVEPNAMLPKQKTYTSLGNIPDYYSYREYDEANEGWWTGMLPLDDIEVVSVGRYKAIYKGTIMFSY